MEFLILRADRISHNFASPWRNNMRHDSNILTPRVILTPPHRHAIGIRSVAFHWSLRSSSNPATATYSTSTKRRTGCGRDTVGMRRQCQIKIRCCHTTFQSCCFFTGELRNGFNSSRKIIAFPDKVVKIKRLVFKTNID